MQSFVFLDFLYLFLYTSCKLCSILLPLGQYQLKVAHSILVSSNHTVKCFGLLHLKVNSTVLVPHDHVVIMVNQDRFTSILMALPTSFPVHSSHLFTIHNNIGWSSCLRPDILQ